MYDLYRTANEKPVCMKIYSNEFHKMKLKFKKPHVDSCHTCDKFAMQIKISESEVKKQELIDKRDLHHEAQEKAYSEKKADTLKSKQCNTLKCFTFDLQQCLPTPALNSNVAFYKRPLWTYNLTIHDNATSEVKCFMWHEAIGGRGANNVASCLYKHLKALPPNVEHIIYYSDTCGGQNKNSYIAAMFTYAMQMLPHINIIDHKFMVPGHSHMEVDCDHSVIEKKKKKTDIEIFHPHDWYQLVRSSSKRFNVIEMQQSSFYDFALVLKGPLALRKKNTENNPFKWHDAVWLRYTKDFGTIQYKDSLSNDEAFKFLSFKRRKTSLAEFILQNITDKPLPISCEKKQDLIALLDLVPQMFHQFYHELKPSKGVKNIDPDLIEEDED